MCHYFVTDAEHDRRQHLFPVPSSGTAGLICFHQVARNIVISELAENALTARLLKLAALTISYAPPFQLPESVPQLLERALCFADFPHSLCGDAEVFLGSATAFRCRFSQFRGNQTFCFESLKRGIDAAKRYSRPPFASICVRWVSRRRSRPGGSIPALP